MNKSEYVKTICVSTDCFLKFIISLNIEPEDNIYVRIVLSGSDYMSSVLLIPVVYSTNPIKFTWFSTLDVSGSEAEHNYWPGRHCNKNLLLAINMVVSQMIKEWNYRSNVKGHEDVIVPEIKKSLAELADFLDRD